MPWPGKSYSIVTIHCSGRDEILSVHSGYTVGFDHIPANHRQLNGSWLPPDRSNCRALEDRRDVRKQCGERLGATRPRDSIARPRSKEGPGPTVEERRVPNSIRAAIGPLGKPGKNARGTVGLSGECPEQTGDFRVVNPSPRPDRQAGRTWKATPRRCQASGHNPARNNPCRLGQPRFGVCGLAADRAMTAKVEVFLRETPVARESSGADAPCVAAESRAIADT